MRRPILFLINIYRKYISRRKGAPCCRYFPSCSNYAYRAVNEWGCVIGLALAVFRILRCNPLFSGGLEQVPRRKRKLIPKTAVLERKKITVDKTADMFDIEDQKAVMIAPVNPKNGEYVPYLTRMERYLD